MSTLKLFLEFSIGSWKRTKGKRLLLLIRFIPNWITFKRLSQELELPE